MIVYLNKVDFSPSQSFSVRKKGIVEEKARTSQNKTHGKLNLIDFDFVLQKDPRSNW